MTKCTCLWLMGPSGPTGRIEDPECPARRVHDKVLGIKPVDDETLDLEFAYTAWSDSCQDVYNLDYQCRRPAYHSHDHAAGFGDGRVRW